MSKTHVKTHEKSRGEKTISSKILPNNQIITACCIELRVQARNDYEQKINYDWTKDMILILFNSCWLT